MVTVLGLAAYIFFIFFIEDEISFSGVQFSFSKNSNVEVLSFNPLNNIIKFFWVVDSLDIGGTYFPCLSNHCCMGVVGVGSVGVGHWDASMSWMSLMMLL